VGQTVLGALDVQSTRPGAFSQADISVLQTMADQLATTLQNARLFVQSQQRVQELAVINDISQTLASRLDLQTRLNLVGEKVIQVFGVRHGYIALYSRATSLIEIAFLAEGDERLHIEPLPLGEGVSSIIIKSRQPLLVNQDTEQRLAVLGAKIVGQAAKSFLGVPIMASGEVIGVVNVQSVDREGLFSDADVNLLSTIAANLGAAIDNARLFEATQRELAERQRAQAELVKVQLGLDRSTEAVFITDVNGTITYANPAFETVYGWKPEEAVGQTPRIIKSGVLSPDNYKDFWGALLNKQVVAGEIINRTKDGRLIPIEGANNPILDESGKIIGFLAMHRDISDRKRAEAELQRRAQQLGAAADVGRAATSSLDLDLLLRNSVELIRDRFGFYHASIFLIEPGSRLAVVRESTGEAGRQLKERQHALAVGSKSVVGQATAGRQPVVVQDVTLDPSHFKNPLLPDTRAEAVVPMLAGDTVVGALDVQSVNANAFAESDIATLVTIADQLAVAVQNARLFERTSRQARREKLVVEITNKIRSAPDVEAMLRTAVTELRQALGVREGMVRLSPVARPLVAPAAPAGGNGHGRGNGSNGSGAKGRPPDNGTGEAA
jgi:PAS domain S-box-containing protein